MNVILTLTTCLSLNCGHHFNSIQTQALNQGRPVVVQDLNDLYSGYCRISGTTLIYESVGPSNHSGKVACENAKKLVENFSSEELYAIDKNTNGIIEVQERMESEKYNGNR